MNLREKTIKGLTWMFSQQLVIQIINISVQIILARILEPEIFGLIAMVFILISIGQNLMDAGMTSSIIRTNKPCEKDYSTVFITNIFISFIFYIIIFLFSPIIADFYNQPILDLVIKVLALNFIIRSLSAVHLAKLTKEMNFKQIAKFQVPSYIFGGIVAILLALYDYKIWSLVFMHLVQSLVFTVQNWLFIKWKPSLFFSVEKFKYHFNFGYKITFSSILGAVFANSFNVVIGKLFTPIQTGFFNHANVYRLFPPGQLSSVVEKVVYPMFSEIKDRFLLLQNYKKILKFLFATILPIMLLSIIIAEELFLIVFGAKWLPAVPFFQILAVASIFKPIGMYSTNILKVTNKPDLILKFQIISNLIGLVLLLGMFSFGITYIAYSIVLSSIITALLHMWISGKQINYSLFLHIKDLFKIFISGTLTFLITISIKILFFNLIKSKIIFVVFYSFFFIILYALIISVFDKELTKSFYRLIKNSTNEK